MTPAAGTSLSKAEKQAIRSRNWSGESQDLPDSNHPTTRYAGRASIRRGPHTVCSPGRPPAAHRLR